MDSSGTTTEKNNTTQTANTGEKLSDKLMRMAGYGNISATAYMIRSRGATPSLNQHPTVCQVDQDKVRKIYIPLYVNNKRVIGCMDSGSDITIMHEGMFNRIFQGKEKLLKKSDISHITTFSDTNIPVLGKMHTFLKPSSQSKGLLITIYIVQNIPHVPIFLVGNDVFKGGLITLSYTGNIDNPYPEIIFNFPEKYMCPVYYESGVEMYNCTAYCSLEPGESQDVIMNLSPIAPIISTDIILITSTIWDDILITPSRTEVEFISSNENFIATAEVSNLGSTHFSGIVKGKFELINLAQSIPISEEYRAVRKMAENYILAREVLHVNSQCESAYTHPCLFVNNVDITRTEDFCVSDLDFADAIIDKEPTYSGEANIGPEIIEAKGLELPTMVYSTAEEAVHLHSFNEEIQPFIKDIFLEKYPNVVSLHSLDAGNLSLTLGYTQLRLREGETLPRSRRIFHISPNDTRHLDDICDLLIKFGFIRKSKLEANGNHLYGMSAYLVPRAKPNCLGRLVIDYSPVNQLIQSPSAVIPEIEATLQFLQGKAMYTSLDLRYAYLGLRIDEESRKLTTFLTPTNTYEWLALPTGAANSPAYFTDACNRMLHYEPEYDDKGNLIYEAPNVVKQKPSPLEFTRSYFDDITCASILKPTYEDTLKTHFEIVEKCVQRMAFHGCKINVPKCEFAKSKILFLGWFVSHDFVIADPRRIQKVKEFNFPNSKKAVRAFLGLVNSLRRILPMDVIEQMSILSPLTSSKAEFKIEQRHKLAFEQIKEMLTREPIFCNLINEKAEKFLFVDAATGSGVLGAVLAQKLSNVDDTKVIPTCLDLEDPVHRIIFDKEFNYEPALLYTKLPIELPKPSVRKTIPPQILTDKPLLGFTEENVHDSFFWSTLSILAIYGCSSKTMLTPLELRKLAITKAKEGVLDNKLKDFVFKLNKDEYHSFMRNFKEGKCGLDSEFILADALASKLARPIIIISSLKRHESRPIMKFNSQCDKAPLIYGVYKRGIHEIFLPFFLNRNVEFRLESLKGKIQIIAYVAKTIPEAFRARSILDLETFAILSALNSLQRYISGVPVKLLTDSRALYYLFSPKIGNSSAKIKRWCLKLISDFPNVTLHFIRTNENLADFLTREGLPPGDLQKFNIKNVQISNFAAELPKEEFTFLEWINFVEEHPEYLTINDPHETKVITLSISNGLNNITEAVQPIEILKEKLARHKIIQRQKIEFAEIYANCLAGEDYEYTSSDNDTTKESVKYKLISDLLFIQKITYRIYIPPSMVGLLISYTHLLGHKGTTRMIADLQNYYFEKMYTLTREFVQSCYSCFLTNKGTRQVKLGVYKTPDYPFQEISMDLAENLNPIEGYAHLLVVQCALTDFLLIYPLKSKQSQHVMSVLLHNVLQTFNVQRIHSDNGPCFRATQWLELFAALNIQVIASAALHPQGRGAIERQIGLIKTILKKMLATRPTLDWEYLPYLVAKILNNSVSSKTGFTPYAMVFGNEGASGSFLNLEPLQHPHYLVRNNKQRIEDLTNEIKSMIAIATDRYTEHKLNCLEYQNKNKIEKRFKRNDYVFVLDRMQIPGNTRPLKTKFHPSPYVVVNTRHTTTHVKRLADGFESVYSNNDLKKFDYTSPLFAQIPPAISRVLLHDFQNLLQSDLCTITRYDNLNAPTGIPLFDSSNEDLNVQNDESLDEEQVDNPSIDKLLDSQMSQNNEDSLNNLTEKIQKSLNEKEDVPKNPDVVNLNPVKESNTQKVTTRAAFKLTQDINSSQKQNFDSDSDEDIPNEEKITDNKRKVRFFGDEQVDKITKI